MSETQTELTKLTPEATVPYDAEAAAIQAEAAENHAVAQAALKFVMDKQGNILTPKEVADATERRSIDVH